MNATERKDIQIQDTRYKIQDTICNLQDTKYNVRYKIQNTKYNVKYNMQDTRCTMIIKERIDFEEETNCKNYDVVLCTVEVS